MPRVFLIVLDSFGIGELPDANDYGDCGSKTIASIVKSSKFNTPCLQNLGLFNIDGVDCLDGSFLPTASFARMAELSKGKDTTVGHWEIAGLVSEKPFPTFPNGFPNEIIDEFKHKTGGEVLCNLPYSGTQVISDYGQEHVQSGALIVYTSADSVFQIAAHEDIVDVKTLYEYCQMARDMLIGDYAVARVIARPFNGSENEYKRTSNRHDFSLAPPSDTMLDLLKANGYDAISIGKISDIFSAKGISESFPTKSNYDGMEKASALVNRDFNGLCFINLVDFDMLYGHRNDIDGYANATTEFDKWLTGFLPNMKADDILIITADHGCDPATESTDHSREYTPMLICGDKIKSGLNLGTRKSFADISATILELFEIQNTLEGESFLGKVTL